MTSDVAKVLVNLWGWLQIGCGLVCIYLAYRGLRTQTLDSHPHCRKCLYDLSGRPKESTRCPECGLDITVMGNIVRGRTQRKWRFLVWAIAIALLAIVADQFVWPMAKDANGRWARLNEAVFVDDSVVAKKLLQQDPGLLDDPEQASYFLARAIRSKSDSAVTLLLEDPRVRARVNAVGSFGNTPLWDAVQHGTPSMITALIAAGANPMQKDRMGTLPLDFVVERRDPSLVAALVAGGADVLAQDQYGQTVLHHGFIRAWHWTKPAMEWLLDSGRISVEVRDGSGNTPLFAAVQNDSDAAMCLLEHGADLLARNNEGISVSQAAVGANRGHVVAVVWERALCSAVVSGRIEHARRLVRAEPWLLKPGPAYATPYPLLLVRRDTRRFASPYDPHTRIEVLKLLFAEGMPVETADANGFTLLHGAAADGNGEVFRFLLEQGADEAARNAQRRTPMMLWPTREGEAILDEVRGKGATPRKALPLER